MKKLTAMILTAAILLTLAACGTSTAQLESDETAAASVSSVESVASAEPEAVGETIDMLYYKNMGDGDLMAACYTDEGIARLGEDYYLIHAGDADIYNASGEPITLEELVRGCPIRITWSGAVTMSIPGQIPAERIDAISDEADPFVPPEDEIGLDGTGASWFAPETPTDVPDLIVSYQNDLAAVSCYIPCHAGTWDVEMQASAVEPPLSAGTLIGGGVMPHFDGLRPWQGVYDDSNTIQREGFDTATLGFSVEPSELTVTAYAYGGDGEPEPETVDLTDGVLTLLDGDHIYAVSAIWEGDGYSGNASYWFLVTEGA